jgi:hypothetical protein
MNLVGDDVRRIKAPKKSGMKPMNCNLSIAGFKRVAQPFIGSLTFPASEVRDSLRRLLRQKFMLSMRYHLWGLEVFLEPMKSQKRS